MGLSVVFLESDTLVTRIATLQDQISNIMSANLGKWQFEYKLYRENPASKDTLSGQPDRFLYTLSHAQLPGEVVCVTDGVATTLKGDFDLILMTKLQSLWIPRQTMKGDGNMYEIGDGEFVFRLVNVTLQGVFKGLLVEVEYSGPATDKDAVIAKINGLLGQFGMTYTKDKLATNRKETAQQYIECLLTR
ncbi:mediator of RNA polymerase II transcription subunit 20 [Trichomonascus vanleenenianus]|uniref:Srb2p n=1 Tax=Trichomonascus vanleenenianus TaxID=2268995 RepID=UPI003ECA2517